MADELEEISGIKPKVWLPDGEEWEVAYKSRYGPDLFPFNDDDFAAISQAFDAAADQVTIVDRGQVITHYLLF